MKLKNIQLAKPFLEQRDALKHFIDRYGTATGDLYRLDQHIDVPTRDIVAVVKVQLGRVEQDLLELGVDLTP